MVAEHWADIDAEYCLAEGGGVERTAGQVRFAAVATTEKIAHTISLVARGTAGHGSVPLQSNAIVHLSQAIARIAAWRTPMRLNDTTRAYFTGLARLSSAGGRRTLPCARRGPRSRARAGSSRRQRAVAVVADPHVDLAQHHQGRLPAQRDSVGGRGDARHPRAAGRGLPGVPRAICAAIVDDPAITVARVESYPTRPGSAPSRLDTEAFKAIEAAHQKVYGVPTLPSMLTGGTDMAQVRARGVQCYGIGPIADTEDAALGFGAHSDQERILEEGFLKFVRVHFEIVRDIASAVGARSTSARVRNRSHAAGDDVRVEASSQPETRGHWRSIGPVLLYAAFIAYQSLADGGAWVCGGDVLEWPRPRLAHRRPGQRRGVRPARMAVRDVGQRRGAPEGSSASASLLASVALVSLFSLALEIAQSCQAGRVSSAIDWATNSAGAVLGAALALLLPMLARAIEPSRCDPHARERRWRATARRRDDGGRAVGARADDAVVLQCRRGHVAQEPRLPAPLARRHATRWLERPAPFRRVAGDRRGLPTRAPRLVSWRRRRCWSPWLRASRCR